ncbi:MAG: hypothetical protein J5696_10575 [Lachnospiraceae bacterium]|nr:hypothetical protein [Lachnospiraceae bacterium]
MDGDLMVLCGANSYDKKYYFNKRFEKIPDSIQKDLHIICVLFTEEVGGIFTISFDEDGEIILDNRCDESDIVYDEVSAGLLIGQIRKNRAELFESLKAYYRVLILGEDVDTVLSED